MILGSSNQTKSNDYHPFGMLMEDTTNWRQDTSYRFGFNGMEKDNNVFGKGGALDFGARIYNSRLGRFLSLDPEFKHYPHQSDYIFASSNPILRIDPTGKWDIEVHTFNQRGKMGYGIAIVKDRHGDEVYRFVIRAVGSAGENARRNGVADGKNLRVIPNGDTPTGTYKIDKNPWWPNNSKQRNAFGSSYRLAMVGVDGEIMESSRGRQSTIRLHAGRQEVGRTGNFDPNNKLKYTNGCLRCFQEELDMARQITLDLEKNDNQEEGGYVTVTDDLVEMNGSYYVQSDLDAYRSTVENAKNEYETTRQTAWEEYQQTGDAERFLAVTDEAIKVRLEKESAAAKDLLSKGINAEEFQE